MQCGAEKKGESKRERENSNNNNPQDINPGSNELRLLEVLFREKAASSLLSVFACQESSYNLTAYLSPPFYILYLKEG